LLGEPEEFDTFENYFQISYELETRYGSDIDPKWIKYLGIKLDVDSCFIEAKVIKSN